MRPTLSLGQLQRPQCMASQWHSFRAPAACHPAGCSRSVAWHATQGWSGAAAAPNIKRRHHSACTRALDTSKEVFEGRFGPWSVEPEDVTEVTLYRVGISVATAAVALGSLPALLPGDAGAAAQQALLPLLDPIVLLGSAGLGASLFLIHIYVDPLKKALQAFWLLGTCGSLWLMATQDAPAAVYVAQNPWAVWLVGPLFASITGVAFKEGLCYGKAEAAALFMVVPLLLLGHLTQLVPVDGQRALLAAMVVIMTVFAARKYTQPIKDDIGDKSIFTFLSKSPQEQQLILERTRQGVDADDA